ncbi:MAG: protease PrsW [Myxococcales bacterium]|nr:protease PrsW [Myxococcales bacterium]
MTAVVLGLALVLAFTAIPAAFAFWIWRTPVLRQRAAMLGGAAALALGLGVGALAIERALLAFVHLEPVTRGSGRALGRVYAFAFAAPLEMAAITTAVSVIWRVRRRKLAASWSHRHAKRDGMAFAMSAALAVALVKNVAYVAGSHTALDLARTVIGSIALAALASALGYAIGRSPERGVGGRRFGLTWFGVTFFSAVAHELVFQHGALAIFAAVPLIGSAVGLSVFLWRESDSQGASETTPRASLLMSSRGPSLITVREAFKRRDRPLTLRGIAFGALVNVGLVGACVAAAIWLGHRAGVSFAVVDRLDAPGQAALPLLVLGVGALAGFPTSGYLIARASGTRSVIEPALSSTLAMVLGLVFLGVVAPTSTVFVMALMPIAFGLSCSGAWFGLA